MSLLPRYSLLTLLVLTALVAGGVKLWYGPHHVVEQTKEKNEVEYTYTRDWHGERIIQGPHILRITKPNKLEISVEYYRSGVIVDHVYYINGDFREQKIHHGRGTMNPFGDEELQPLQPEELREFEAAIEREFEPLRQRGLKQLPPLHSK
jgi:hypothetical protein